MPWITRALRRAPGLAAVAAAEAAWHLLGPAWAFGLLAAAIMWWLPAAIMPPAVKAYAVEDRLNALVPQIPSPKAAPAGHSDTTSSPGNSSYGASNSSYGASNGSWSMGGGSQVTYAQDVGNNGGANSATSGQIGGASAHYHSMTHYHTNSTDLQNTFNALQGTMSSLVPAVNTLRDSHSNLVPAVNALRDSHSALVTSVQGLQASHANLSDRHNALIDTIKTTRLLT
jgi:hypothetical protein